MARIVCNTLFEIIWFHIRRCFLSPVFLPCSGTLCIPIPYSTNAVRGRTTTTATTRVVVGITVQNESIDFSLRGGGNDICHIWGHFHTLMQYIVSGKAGILLFPESFGTIHNSLKSGKLVIFRKLHCFTQKLILESKKL